MIVDTSVWIDFFNDVRNRHSEFLAEAIKSDETIYLHSIILMEILQGFRSDRDYAAVKDILLAYEYLSEEPIADALGASNMYRMLKKNGVTIRKSMDCLIAFAAVKNGMPLLHRDRDFDIIAKLTKLKIVMP